MPGLRESVASEVVDVPELVEVGGISDGGCGDLSGCVEEGNDVRGDSVESIRVEVVLVRRFLAQILSTILPVYTWAAFVACAASWAALPAFLAAVAEFRAFLAISSRRTRLNAIATKESISDGADRTNPRVPDEVDLSDTFQPPPKSSTSATERVVRRGEATVLSAQFKGKSLDHFSTL